MQSYSHSIDQLNHLIDLIRADQVFIAVSRSLSLVSEGVHALLPVSMIMNLGSGSEVEGRIQFPDSCVCE